RFDWPDTIQREMNVGFGLPATISREMTVGFSRKTNNRFPRNRAEAPAQAPGGKAPGAPGAQRADGGQALGRGKRQQRLCESVSVGASARGGRDPCPACGRDS